MLSPTMSSSLRGMQAAEYALMIRSNNVANANNKDYQRLEAEPFNDINKGVDISVVRQQIDEYTELERYKYTSLVNYYETKSEIYNKIDLLIGKPSVLWDKDYITNSQNIVETVDNFFESMERFSAEPELIINKTEFIEKAKILTNDLKILAENFSQLRLDLDQQIFKSLTKVSNSLDFVYKINKDLNTKLANNKNEVPELMMQQNKILKDLSEYMDVKYTRNSKHQLTVQDHFGTILANEFSAGVFHYHPWNNKGYIGSDDVFHEITLLSNKHPHKMSEENFGNGKIRALLELRNKGIPVLLEEFDNFTNTLVQAMNDAYVSGVSFPGKSEWISSAVNSTEKTPFVGDLKLILLDDRGSPAKSEIDGHYIPLLSIDLNDKNWIDVIEEINHYYHIHDSHVEIGRHIDDLTIVTKKSNGRFYNFDLELSNFTDEEGMVTLKDISLMYKNNSNEDIEINNILETGGDFKNKTFKVAANTNKRFDNDFIIDISKLPPTAKNFRIKLEFVNEGHIKEVEYQTYIDAINRKNDRLHPIDIGGDDIKITQPRDRKPYVTAKLQYDVTDKTLSHLELKTRDNYRLALDISNIKNALTREKVINFLELNTLFQPIDKKDATHNIKIQQHLIDSPFDINQGKLTESSRHKNLYMTGAGDNRVVLDMINMSNKLIKFDQIELIPETESTLKDYILYIIDNIAIYSRNTSDETEKMRLFKDALDTKSINVSGVNIDEEMAKMGMLEKVYGASQKTFKTASDMFDTLLDIA